MKKAPIPSDDTLRLEKLRQYQVLDTASQKEFDDITSLAALICETEISLVSLVDQNRQWFKSKVGLNAQETPRDISYCGHAIMGDELFIVENAALDERFKDNPLFLNAPHVCFYAGAPLITPEGFKIGTLCVIDPRPKKLSEIQKKMLIILSRQIVTLLELKLKNEILLGSNQQSLEIQSMSNTGGWELDIQTFERKWTDQMYKIFQIPKSALNNKTQTLSYFIPSDQIRIQKMIDEAILHQKDFEGEFQFIDANQQAKWVRCVGKPVFGTNGKVVKLIGTFQDITVRKNFELQLIESETRHRTLFDQSFDAQMAIVPPDWKFTTCNPATLKLFGVESEEEFLKLGPWDLSPETQPSGEASASLAKTMIENAMREGSHFFEWSHKKKDGTIIPCTVLLSKIIIGHQQFLQATVRDISVQKKAIRELNKFFELSLNYLCIAGVDGYFKRINRAWLDFGYSEQELLSINFLDLIHPDDIAKTLVEIEKLKNGSNTIEFINRYKMKNGEYRYLKWSTSPDTETGLLYAAAADITAEIKRQNNTLLISEIRAAYIENSNDFCTFTKVLCSKLSKLFEGQYCNIIQLVEDKLGKYKIFQMENKKLPHNYIINFVDAHISEILSNKIINLSQISIDNVSYDSFISIPVFYSGKIVAIVIIAKNKGRFEQHHLSEFSSVLETVGEVIHNMNQDEQLQRQEMIALHNSKLASIGQLAAGVGHEINNPLAIIAGQLSIAKMLLEKGHGFDESVQDRFQKIQLGINRISNIVKGLRTFSRDDDNQDMPFNLSELIKESVFMLRDIYNSENIDIQFEDGPAAADYLGNRGKIQQVLVNLISNAKDAVSGKSHRLIKVRSFYDGDNFIIKVSDNGMGIPDEIKEKIFEPFFTTKAVNQGTGIGLSLVNSIVKEHEGHIEFESKVGEGTIFTITLPSRIKSFTIADLAAKKSKMSKINSNTEIEKIRHKCSVLIVEDEEILLEIMQFKFDLLCENVFIARNGQEALAILDKTKIDLIVADYKMPIMDGYQLLLEIRKKFNTSKPPFFFISGGIDFDLQKQLEIDGQYLGVLPKPLPDEVLVEKLNFLFPLQIKKLA